MFFGDHGSGMPRHKRYAGDSGMRVPLVVYVPDELKHLCPSDFRPGARTNRPVGFVDLAPTTLSVAGVKVPKFMQGRAFLGDQCSAPGKYLLGLRGRMDERVDLSRSLRDERFLYIRNFMPHLPHGQILNYQMITPTTRSWKKAFDDGKLNAVQSAFWKPKPHEELYDLKQDPFETKNLAGDPAYQKELDRLRTALKSKLLEIRDTGFLPEPMLNQIKLRESVREFCSRNNSYPLEKIYELASHAASGASGASELDTLKSAAVDSNPVLRYWALMGLLIRGEKAFQETSALLETGLADEEPAVAIVAAELLARFGVAEQQSQALEILLRFANPENDNFFTAVHSLNAIDRLDEHATSIMEPLASLPQVDKDRRRGKDYLQRLHEHIKRKN